MKGVKIGTIEVDDLGLQNVVMGRYSDGDRIAIWVEDPYVDSVPTFVTYNAPSVMLEFDEILIKPRKSIRKILDSLLTSNILEDTGNRVSIGYSSQAQKIGRAHV